MSPRRWGKTSLVNRVAQSAGERNRIIVQMDIFACRSEYDFYNTFSAAILKQTASKIEEWWDWAKGFIERLSPKLAASPEAVRDEDPSEILKKIKNHITARIDVNIQGSSYTQLELLHCSDAKARITNPDWFQKNGIGYQIESFALQLRLRFHCQSDGSLRVKLRGKSVFDKNNKRIPYWIDYTSLTVNEKTQFKGRRSACHDASLTFTFPVKEGDNIELNMEWDAHLGQSPTE